MSSSPPPTKKFFLKPSALKVPTPSLDSAIASNKGEPVKQSSSSDAPAEDVDDGTKGSLLRPSALKVQTHPLPQEIKPSDSTATETAKISFPPLTPPKETSADKKQQSPIPTELRDSLDNGQSIANGHKGAFVFGERLEDRVTISEQPPPHPNKLLDDPSKPKIVNPGDGVGTKEEPNDKEARKRPFEVLTGEEDESNVLQIHCRLYQWETSDAIWREKGNGSLKLNDRMKDGKLCSRLVMRTSGNLKVILNSSLVVGMSFSKSNEKSLRFTNVDGIYTVKGKEKDIELLFSAVDYRLRELAKKMKSDGEPGGSVDTERGIKRSDVEEDETNSRSEVEEEDKRKNPSNVPNNIIETPLEGGCFSTIREQANVDDLSN